MVELAKTELGNWLAAERGRTAELARRCDVPRPQVSDWASGKAAVPVKHCPTVEEFTGGAITAEMLQPTVRWYVLRGSGRLRAASCRAYAAANAPHQAARA